MSDAIPPQSPSSIDDEALEWVVRLHSGQASDQDQRACEAWQHLSPAHQLAFRNASHLWDEVGQLGPPWGAASQTMPAAGAQPHRWRPRLRQWSLVASVFLALGYFTWEPLLTHVHLQTAQHRTAVGQQQQVLLEDGTRVMLNTDTAFNVVFSPQRRDIHLLNGEAAFAVARDPTRPFTVQSQNITTTALGTKFVVQRHQESVTITVSEHAVQISSSIIPTTPSMVVQEGQQISYSPEQGWSSTRAVDADQASAWQRGKMIFEAQPLGAVIADLNRYRHGHIFILNPSLRALPVTGVFEIADPDAALRIIEQALSIRDTSLSPYFLFLH